MTIVWILVAIVVVIVLWAIGGYNGLVKLKVLVEEAFSGIDIFLKKRFDLIPNLVETVKGYAKHEAETLMNVVQARGGVVNNPNASHEDKIAADKEVTGALRQLMVVVEQYPNLKADTQFLNLQTQLTSVENDLAQSRKYYNGTVRNYNTKCRTFPTVILAGIFGYKPEPFFEISDEAERQNVQIKF